MSEMENLRKWVERQAESPTLHINGNDHPTALITVDFGQPLTGVSMTSERSGELSALARAAAKSLTRRRGQLRTSYDNHRGVFWVSIS